jgi:hypothetical protein
VIVGNIMVGHERGAARVRRDGRSREVAWCGSAVETGGCREGRFDALVVEVVVVSVDSGAIVVDFRGGREKGGTGTNYVVGVAGDNASRGEADDCVCAITVQDSEERVVGEGSESDRGDYFWGDPVRGETRGEGGGLKLPFQLC